MFQVLLCFGFLISAWATWRANPMFSVRSTVRAIAVMLLVISGAILLVVGAVRLSEGHSTTFIFVALGIAVVIDVWLMTVILTILTTPATARPAALPHGTVLVHTNRRTALRWTAGLSIAVAVMFLIGILLPETGRIMLFTLGGFTAFIMIVLLPVLYWAERNIDKAQTAVTLSPWVHWSYTPAQWAAWADVQRDRLQSTAPTITLRRTGPKLMFAIAGIAVAVYLMCPGGRLWKTWYILAVAALLLAVMAASARSERHAGDTLRRKLLHAAPEVYFGRDGLLADGTFSPWVNNSTYLVSAACDDREPRGLLFHFERQVPNPYGGPNTVQTFHSVLLPEHCEADVARLAQELAARCPNAQIHLA